MLILNALFLYLAAQRGISNVQYIRPQGQWNKPFCESAWFEINRFMIQSRMQSLCCRKPVDWVHTVARSWWPSVKFSSRLICCSALVSSTGTLKACLVIGYHLLISDPCLERWKRGVTVHELLGVTVWLKAHPMLNTLKHVGESLICTWACKGIISEHTVQKTTAATRDSIA